MKNVKIFLINILIVVILSLLFSGISFAEGEDSQWTDLTNAKIELKKVEQNTYDIYKLYVTGINKKDNRGYFVYLSIGTNQPNFETEGYGAIENDGEVSWRREEINTSGALDRIFERAGDIYVWLVEKNYENESYGEPYKTKIDRPQLRKLGTRINGSFMNDKTRMFFWEPRDITREEGSRKVNIKIGTEDDHNVLMSIKNGESDCLQKLLNYAKQASSPIYTGKVPLGDSSSITSNMNLDNNNNYYVYMEMDDENEIYFPVEDVSLYQAIVTEETGKNLFDYLDDNFKWDIENITIPEVTGGGKTDPTIATVTKLPNTGINIIIAMIAGLVVIASLIGYLKYRKYKDIK